MSKILERIRKLDFVAFVDDEREIGNGIIVTLRKPYMFKIDPGCGVRGFDTVKETAIEIRRKNIYKENDK